MPTVRELMATYFEGRQDRSLGTLARRSGTPHSTLRRIISGEAVPTYETAVAVLGVVADRESMMACLKEHFPKTSALLEKTFKFQEGQTSFSGDDTEALFDFLQHTPHYAIIHLAGTRTGTTRERITRLFGEPAEKAVDEMLDAGVLSQINNRIRLRADSFSVTDGHVARHVTSELMRNFDVSKIGTEAAFLGHLGESVNEAGLAKMKEAISRCCLEITAIKEDPTYSGPIPFYSVLALNVLDDTDYKGELK